MDRPVYLALPPGPSLQAARTAVPGAVELAPPLRSLDLAALDPGLLLVEAGTALTDVIDLAGTLPPDGGGWTLAVLTDAREGAFRTLSLGRAHGLTEVAGGEADGPSPKPVVDLHGALRDIAKARHDLNNPLTSAMAETQLALLDAPEGELREALEIVQAQLRRLRDLIASTSHLRPFKN